MSSKNIIISAIKCQIKLTLSSTLSQEGDYLKDMVCTF